MAYTDQFFYWSYIYWKECTICFLSVEFVSWQVCGDRLKKGSIAVNFIAYVL